MARELEEMMIGSSPSFPNPACRLIKGKFGKIEKNNKKKIDFLCEKPGGGGFIGELKGGFPSKLVENGKNTNRFHFS